MTNSTMPTTGPAAGPAFRSADTPAWTVKASFALPNPARPGRFRPIDFISSADLGQRVDGIDGIDVEGDGYWLTVRVRVPDRPGADACPDDVLDRGIRRAAVQLALALRGTPVRYLAASIISGPYGSHPAPPAPPGWPLDIDPATAEVLLRFAAEFLTRIRYQDCTAVMDAMVPVEQQPRLSRLAEPVHLRRPDGGSFYGWSVDRPFPTH